MVSTTYVMFPEILMTTVIVQAFVRIQIITENATILTIVLKYGAHIKQEM